jgi:hypothetical protein
MATQPPYNQAQNDQARAIVLAMTQPMIQRIGTFSVDPANQNVLNIPRAMSALSPALSSSSKATC